MADPVRREAPVKPAEEKPRPKPPADGALRYCRHCGADRPYRITCGVYTCAVCGYAL